MAALRRCHPVLMARLREKCVLQDPVPSGSWRQLKIFFPMVFEVATEKFKELKTIAEPHLNCLTRLLTLEAWSAPDCLLQVIEKLPEDQAILEKGIHQF